MIVPVWIKDGKTPRPQSDTYYIIAANGICLHKQTLFGKVTVPVDRIGILENEMPSFVLTLPPLPKEIVRSIVQFFAWIAKTYGTEVVAVVWFNPHEQSWRVSIPKQDLGSASLKYENIYEGIDDLTPGEFAVGTFHSHVGMDAFHSSVDTHDERTFGDGIHVTLGSFRDWAPYTFSASIEASVNSYRFRMDPLQWLQGIMKHSWEALWEERKKQQEEKALEETRQNSVAQSPSEAQQNAGEGQGTPSYKASQSPSEAPPRRSEGGEAQGTVQPAQQPVTKPILFTSYGAQHQLYELRMEDEPRQEILPCGYEPPPHWTDNLNVPAPFWNPFGRGKKGGKKEEKTGNPPLSTGNCAGSQPVSAVERIRKRFQRSPASYVHDSSGSDGSIAATAPPAAKTSGTDAPKEKLAVSASEGVVS